jgi:hypothetical protein
MNQHMSTYVWTLFIFTMHLLSLLYVSQLRFWPLSICIILTTFIFIHKVVTTLNSFTIPKHNGRQTKLKQPQDPMFAKPTKSSHN